MTAATLSSLQRIDLRRRQFGAHQRERAQPLDQHIAQGRQQHAQLIALEVMAAGAGRKQAHLRLLGSGSRPPRAGSTDRRTAPGARP